MQLLFLREGTPNKVPLDPIHLENIRELLFDSDWVVPRKQDFRLRVVDLLTRVKTKFLEHFRNDGTVSSGGLGKRVRSSAKKRWENLGPFLLMEIRCQVKISTS